MSVVVITGTSSGIGLASAIAFARAGHTTYATMRNLGKAEALREAAAKVDVSLHIETLDVTDGESVDRLFRVVDQREGRVDVVVNNAGIGGASPLELVPEEEHRAMFETNYWGAVRTIQAVLPGMRERGVGVIVNVSSGAGLVASPNQVPYCASKWALEALSETLAFEMRPFGVRVVLIEPGVVATQVFENSASMTRFDKTSPYKPLMKRSGWLYRAGFKKPGRAEDVAAVILDAVHSDSAPLRHIVGEDAEKLVAGRRKVSDEDFLALAELDDDAYKARYLEIFGIEL
jgi:NAD(P)-dependent dehydrogenase (short-subunit alcohol dehydrogenase family)